MITLRKIQIQSHTQLMINIIIILKMLVVIKVIIKKNTDKTKQTVLKVSTLS